MLFSPRITKYIKTFGSLWFLLPGLLWLAAPRMVHAEACQCAGTPITTWPGNKQVAPRNTQILVRLPAHNKGSQFAAHKELINYPRLWTSAFDQTQVFVQLINNNTAIPADQINLTTGEWRMIILKPKKVLKPKQTYHLRLVTQVGWNAKISQFSTSGEIDTTPPAAPGLAGARYIWERKTPGSCLSNKPYALLEFQKAKAEGLYGIWLASPGGAVDYKQFPSLILTPNKGRIILGRAFHCDETNFVFPDQPTITVAVRRTDLAGNWGPPQLVSFAYHSTLKPWSWSPGGRVAFWFVLGFLIFLLATLRAWLFQRKSYDIVGDYLATHTEVKNDMAWLALRQLVEKETPLRRNNLILAIIQLVLVIYGFVILFLSSSHFSSGQSALSELYLTFGPWFLFLLVGWGLNILLTMLIKNRRHKVTTLDVAASFQKPHRELLTTWRKK